MEIYYDEEADYLEIFSEERGKDYGEHINEDVVLFKDQETDEILGVGIFNFKKRAKNLQNILASLPFTITVQGDSQS